MKREFDFAVKSHFETARGKFNQICFCTGNYANKRLREEEADGKDTNLSQATKRKRVCTGKFNLKSFS